MQDPTGTPDKDLGFVIAVTAVPVDGAAGDGCWAVAVFAVAVLASVATVAVGAVVAVAVAMAAVAGVVVAVADVASQAAVLACGLSFLNLAI